MKRILTVIFILCLAVGLSPLYAAGPQEQPRAGAEQIKIRMHWWGEAEAPGMARWVQESDVFELAAPVPLNLVCFRQKGGDKANQQLME